MSKPDFSDMSDFETFQIREKASDAALKKLKEEKAALIEEIRVASRQRKFTDMRDCLKSALIRWEPRHDR